MTDENSEINIRNRRDFFKKGFRYALQSVGEVGDAIWPLLNFASTDKKLQRPPGALPEAGFLEKCTRCDECVKVCPPQAIMKHLETGSVNHLTPVIDERRQACVWCDDLPCISVCEPGALVPSETDGSQETLRG